MTCENDRLGEGKQMFARRAKKLRILEAAVHAVAGSGLHPSDQRGSRHFPS